MRVWVGRVLADLWSQRSGDGKKITLMKEDTVSKAFHFLTHSQGCALFFLLSVGLLGGFLALYFYYTN